MSVFLDSCLFIALLNTRDEKHEKAKRILIELKKSRYGSLQTTDYVVDEVLTTIWGHTKNKDLVKKAYRITCQKSDFIKLKKIQSKHFDLAWEKWNQFAEWPKRPLSFTDCTILAYMELENMEFLATFDDEFKGLIKLVPS